MSCPLPREMLDLIVDNLHNDPKTLKSCCLVSKAWVYRTRRYLFYHVMLPNPEGDHSRQWTSTFLDPLNSPAHHTRILSIDFSTWTAAEAPDILLAFFRVTHLNLDIIDWDGTRLSLAPLHGFSPTVRSLHLSFEYFPTSEIFGLIRSLPLLEDLSFIFRSSYWGEGWNPPSTIPIPTSSLQLELARMMPDVTRLLLDLPNGLHFRRIAVLWMMAEDIRPTMDLVSGCSQTLESLEIAGNSIDAAAKPSVDLSKATKLRDLIFICETPNVEWIAAVLCTAEIKTLQTISLVVHPHAAIEASTRQGWPTVDDLLVRFWISHSIRPKLSCEWDWGDCMGRLLPKSTRRGIIDLVEEDVDSLD